MNVLEEFPENARKMAVEIANHVIDRVQFVPWTPEQMERLWRRRSYGQIIGLKNNSNTGRVESGNKFVNVCVPCIDTAAIGAELADFYRLADKPEFTIMTEKGAAEAFVCGEKRKLHLDAGVGFHVDGVKYYLDIGAGDITLMKAEPRNENYGVFLTTRPSEPIWNRTILGSFPGKKIIQGSDKSPLQLILDSMNGPLPFGLTREHFFQYNPNARDNDDFYNHAEGFDSDLERARNEGWTEGVQHVFPGLNPFRYAEV